MNREWKRAGRHFNAAVKSKSITRPNAPLEPHGDRVCRDCRRPNPVWYTDNDTWNHVMPDEGVLCPTCFLARVEATDLAGRVWKVSLG